MFLESCLKSEFVLRFSQSLTLNSCGRINYDRKGILRGIELLQAQHIIFSKVTAVISEFESRLA